MPIISIETFSINCKWYLQWTCH